MALLRYRANWLSKRKAEMALQRRTAGLRESAIPRKTYCIFPDYKMHQTIRHTQVLEENRKKKLKQKVW